MGAWVVGLYEIEGGVVFCMRYRDVGGGWRAN